MYDRSGYVETRMQDSAWVKPLVFIGAFVVILSVLLLEPYITSWVHLKAAEMDAESARREAASEITREQFRAQVVKEMVDILGGHENYLRYLEATKSM